MFFSEKLPLKTAPLSIRKNAFCDNLNGAQNDIFSLGHVNNATRNKCPFIYGLDYAAQVKVHFFNNIIMIMICEVFCLV